MKLNTTQACMAGHRHPTPHEMLISAINGQIYQYAYSLIQAGTDINTPDENGETPLILMLKSRMSYCKPMQTYGNDKKVHATIDLTDKIIHLMLSKGAVTDMTDLDGRSVLDLIIENKFNEHLFVSAIQRKIHLPDDAVDKLIAGKLISADVGSFIPHNIDVALEALDIAGPVQAAYPTPVAAAFGNERLLTLLLQKNSTNPLETGYEYHEKSLYHAVRKHQWDCAEILIKAGHSYTYDPDALITKVLTTGKCTNMTVVNYCVSHLSDSREDFSDTGFEGLISMLKDANVDIAQPDAFGNTLLEATLDCGLQGSDLYKLLAVLLAKFPELVPQAIENLGDDHDGLQFLFESELGEEADYAGQLYEFIVENEVLLDFDSAELLQGAAHAYAASLLSADANQLM